MMPSSLLSTVADTMQALTWRNNHLAVEALPLPVLAEGEALVQVLTAGVCNTDLELIQGYMGYEGTLGHEFVGTVVGLSEELVATQADWLGKRVCVDINAACTLATSPEHCTTCGHPHHCPNRTVIGIVNHDGGFAHYMKAPLRNLYEVPASVSNDRAVFCEPLAAAFEIPEQLKLSPETKVIVLGDGKLGLLIAMTLRLFSNNVVLAGKHPEKLALVADLGIETVLSSTYQPTALADVVVEVTGTASGLQQAIDWTKPRGTVVLKSTVAQGAALNLAPVVINTLANTSHFSGKRVTQNRKNRRCRSVVRSF
ncbi:MAG: alcohol dehydrogenase catalytic domain-containing protein [Candidatus Melainabacteria bacterium]|nr:alcohol dehydrogenase catalytic domain-containing protein [Candidatus Melainabacteria bacterium]